VFDDEDGGRKKASIAEADLDITPMIDVTFLLLIFFMVTSTMQGTPDRDIPVAKSGSARSPSGMLELIVAAPVTEGGTAELILEGKPATMEEAKAQIASEAATGDVEIMILAERRVPSGFIGDVEAMLAEVENVTYHFGVQEKH
jgi:biopolymer transport protein TolR